MTDHAFGPDGWRMAFEVGSPATFARQRSHDSEQERPEWGQARQARGVHVWRSPAEANRRSARKTGWPRA